MAWPRELSVDNLLHATGGLVLSTPSILIVFGVISPLWLALTVPLARAATGLLREQTQNFSEWRGMEKQAQAYDPARPTATSGVTIEARPSAFDWITLHRFAEGTSWAWFAAPAMLAAYLVRVL